MLKSKDIYSRLTTMEEESDYSKRSRGIADSSGDAVDETENSSRDPMREVIFNHVILENLFDCLPFPDFLNCSLVCKEWYRLFRVYMKKSGRCLLSLNHDDTCSNIQDLNTALKNWEAPIPFCGLAVTTSDNEAFGFSDNRREPGPAWMELVEILLTYIRNGDMKFQSLRFNLLGLPSLATEAGLQLLLETFSNILEEIFLESVKLHVLPADRILFREIPTLTNVKKLTASTNKGLNYELIKRLIDSSPILRRLTEVDDESSTYRGAGSSKGKVVLRDDIMRPMETQLPVWTAVSRSSPKLQSFQFLKDFDARADRWIAGWKIVQRILVNSQHCLRELHLDHYALAFLPHFDLPSLVLVKHLSVDFSLYRGGESVFNVLTKIDYSHYFPNVQRMRVRYTTYAQHCESLPPDGNDAVFDCPTVSAFILEPVFIKNEIVEGVVQPTWISKFAQAFPNVKEFCMKRGERLGPLLGMLWFHWPFLERMAFAQTHPSTLVTDLEEAFKLAYEMEQGTSMDGFHILPTSNKLEGSQRSRTFSLEVKPVRSNSPAGLMSKWLRGSSSSENLSQVQSLTARIAATEDYYRIPVYLKLLREGHEEVGQDMWSNVGHLRSTTDVFFKRTPKKGSTQAGHRS